MLLFSQFWNKIQMHAASENHSAQKLVFLGSEQPYFYLCPLSLIFHIPLSPLGDPRFLLGWEAILLYYDLREESLLIKVNKKKDRAEIQTLCRLWVRQVRGDKLIKWKHVGLYCQEHEFMNELTCIESAAGSNSLIAGWGKDLEFSSC